MTVGQVMKHEVVSISQDRSFEEALQTMVSRRIGLLPVVDGQAHLAGVLRLGDALGIVLPDIFEDMKDLDFVEDFGAVEAMSLPEPLRGRPVRDLMQPAQSIRPEASLTRAMVYMRQHQLSDVPVVDEANRLVGLASWVDVGTGFLRDCLSH